MKTSVMLSDADLATLIDSMDPAVALAAEQALARHHAVTKWPDIPAHAAALVADVVHEARLNGRLINRGVAISHCRYCDARPEWKKPPRKRTEREYKLSGVEFADRFLIVTGHISVGACRACVDAALSVLRVELAAFPVQLAAEWRLEGAPVYQRWELCQCKECQWFGHEGQLGKLRTLMGDGDYPGKCPSCGAENRPFGEHPIERREGFVVEPVANLSPARAGE